MAVAQPTYLLAFNEASGTSITNYGTQGTAFTIGGSGSSPTNYEWTSNADPILGYLAVKTGNGANAPVISNAGAAHSTSMVMNSYSKFRIDSLPQNRSYILSAANRAYIRANAPSAGGDYDLQIAFRTSAGFGYTSITVATALTFGTDHVIVASCSLTGSTLQALYKVDGNSVVTPGSQSDGGGDTGDTSVPSVNVGSYEGFTTDLAVVGRIYSLAFQVGGTAWSSGDLDSIYSSPGFITGWPGGGGSAIAALSSNYHLMGIR